MTTTLPKLKPVHPSPPSATLPPLRRLPSSAVPSPLAEPSRARRSGADTQLTEDVVLRRLAHDSRAILYATVALVVLGIVTLAVR